MPPVTVGVTAKYQGKSAEGNGTNCSCHRDFPQTVVTASFQSSKHVIVMSSLQDLPGDSSFPSLQHNNLPDYLFDSDSEDSMSSTDQGDNKDKDKDKLDPEVLKELEKHQGFMRQAINVAEDALAGGETPVACVLVLKGEVVARGMNDTNRSLNGTRHAEFLAISEFLSKYPQSKLRETDLYVTVEPCIMCASALRQYGIRCVYYGCGNDRFGGNGSVLAVNSDKGLEKGYPSYGGIFRKEAIMLLRRFYIQENENAPNPRAKGNRELKPVV